MVQVGLQITVNHLLVSSSVLILRVLRVACYWSKRREKKLMFIKYLYVPIIVPFI